LICAGQGGHFALFSVLWFFVRQIAPSTWILAPIGWVIVEEFWPGLFPCRAGNLFDSLPLLCQTASLGGVQLVSLLFLFFAGGLACLMGIVGQFSMGHPVRSDWCRGVILSILLFIATLWFGDMNLRLVRSKIAAANQMQGLQVLVIQADTEFPDSHSKMIKISRQFEKQVDLIIWPESALGDYQESLVDFSQTDSVTVEGAVVKTTRRPLPNPGTCLLAGGDTWKQTSDSDDGPEHFVSAFLVDQKERVMNRHDKVYLMPYGESIPGERWFPILRSWFTRDGRISEGEHIRPLGKIAGTTIGAVLCCEDMQPELIRQLVLQKADLVVTLGNGTAFNSEIALRQHFRIAQMRAIENRRYFLRCTSHGISGLVAPTGDLLVELPVQKDVATPITVPNPSLGQTLFTRWGWRIAFPLLFGTSLFGWLMVRQVTPKGSAS
jgi:apolipoprotein N-acyltransferase